MHLLFIEHSAYWATTTSIFLCDWMPAVLEKTPHNLGKQIQDLWHWPLLTETCFCFHSQIGSHFAREEDPVPYMVSQPLPWQVHSVSHSRRSSKAEEVCPHQTLYKVYLVCTYQQWQSSRSPSSHPSVDVPPIEGKWWLNVISFDQNQKISLLNDCPILHYLSVPQVQSRFTRCVSKWALSTFHIREQASR